MENALKIAEQATGSIGTSINKQAIEIAKEQAQLLAKSNLIPKDYQQNPANCLIAFNMSQRLGADPMMVMQNLYIVHGRPGWSSQFLIATFNQSPEYGALRYEFKGEEGTDAWACRAVAREKSTGDLLTGPWVSIEIAKKEGWFGKNGSKWQTIPELMLRYRAAGFFIRTTAPEISMGLQTAEELHDVYDAEQQKDGTYVVRTTEDALDAFADGDSMSGDVIVEDAQEVEPVPEPEQETADETVDAETGEILDMWHNARWRSYGVDPLKKAELFDDMETQLELVAMAGSESALAVQFITQEPAIIKFSDKDQLVLMNAYNKRRKELRKG